jgi:hypothetical protein
MNVVELDHFGVILIVRFFAVPGDHFLEGSSLFGKDGITSAA